MYMYNYERITFEAIQRTLVSIPIPILEYRTPNLSSKR